MRRHLSKILALSLLFAGACGAQAQRPQATLKIAQATVYVDDQEKALHFYTEVLGLAEKDDFTNGDYRWLTVTAPDSPDGTELLLALDSDPAAKALQEATFQQGRPAIMFYTDDVHGDVERIKARGGELTLPPTEVEAGSVIALVKDTCGNLVQITQLAD
jgi:predicted enzyme related to lactoylglutathione lyase